MESGMQDTDLRLVEGLDEKRKSDVLHMIPYLMTIPHGPGLAGMIVFLRPEDKNKDHFGWLTAGELKDLLEPLADSEEQFKLWLALFTECPFGMACIYVVDASRDDRYSVTICATRDQPSMSMGGEA